MADIKIYFKRTCPFCLRAIKRLKDAGVDIDHGINYIEVTSDEIKQQMIAETGANTVPQIYINDEYIGGCDDLHKLSDEQLTEKLNNPKE